MVECSWYLYCHCRPRKPTSIEPFKPDPEWEDALKERPPSALSYLSRCGLNTGAVVFSLQLRHSFGLDVYRLHQYASASGRVRKKWIPLVHSFWNVSS